MMFRRSYCLILAACLLLVAGGCTREAPMGADGFITLNFGTGDADTKATGNAADGGKIVVDGSGNPDLIIAIVNSSNAIVAWYPEGFETVPLGNGYSSEVTSSHTASTPADNSTITISGPGKGTYTVYVVANTNAAGLTAARTSLAAATTLSGLEAVKLSVTGDDSPGFGSMPLSAKGTLSVNASGSGQIDLTLLRVVAKVGLTFENKTGDDGLKLYNCSVTLYKMNPSQGYLFPMGTDYVSGFDRNLGLSGETNPIEIGNNESVSLPAQLVFPSTAPAQEKGRRYLCDISFRTVKAGKTYDSADADTYDNHSYTKLPVHDSRSADIQAIERNKRYNIMTRINKRAEDYEVSFNFEVCTWNEVTQSIEFD